MSQCGNLTTSLWSLRATLPDTCTGDAQFTLVERNLAGGQKEFWNTLLPSRLKDADRLSEL